jgi:hypothetical protein
VYVKRPRSRWPLGALAALVAALPALAADPVEPRQFDSLRRAIKPAPGEDLWASIPWQTNLWQARERAAAAGKPLLLWEMDGHPLGCT